MPGLLLLSLRQLGLKPSRALLTALGIAAGVALYVSVTVINAATLASFRESTEAIAGKAALSVLGPEAGFPEELFRKVAETKGVAHAVPLMETRAIYRGRDGQERTLVVFGVDVTEEAEVRTYKVTDLKFVEHALSAMSRADSVILTHAFCDREKLDLGSTIELSTAYGKHAFTVQGILTPEGVARAYGGEMAVVDIFTARSVFGKDGLLDRIDVVLAPGESPRDVEGRIRAALGPGFRVGPPAEQGTGVARVVESYQLVLSGLSLVALLVSLFLVGNTVSAAVTERRREIATLRALGGTRSFVVSLFIGEALVMGVAGSLAGVLAGRGLAVLLAKTVAGSLSAMAKTPIVVSALAMTPKQMALGALFGAGASALAALVPALRAAGVHPLETLRASAAPAAEGAKRALPHPGWLGVALLAALPALAALPVADRPPLLDAAEAVCAIAGALLGGAWFIRLGLGLVRKVTSRAAGRRAIVLRLACDNLLRPRRTSGTEGLLASVVLIVIAAAVSLSFGASMGRWFDRIIRWDLLVTSPGNLASGQTQPLHESIGEELAAIDGVERPPGGRAPAIRFGQVGFRGAQITLKAFDRPRSEGEWGLFDYRGRSMKAEAVQMFDSPGPAAIVSETFESRFGVRKGDVLQLDTPSGPTRFAVVGVATDFMPDGVIYLSREVYRRLWRDPLVTAFGLQVAKGQNVAEVRKRLEEKYAPRGLVVMANKELRDQSLAIIDQAFSFATVLELAALLVSLFALLNALLRAVLERTRELGMLRAVGMSRGQLAGMVVTEATLAGAMTGLVAVAVGLYVSWAWLIKGVSGKLGWELGLQVPWGAALGAVLSGVAVGALAAWIPARRAGGLDIREAIAYE